MKHFKMLMFILSACFLAGYSLANAQKLISFDAPNAGTGAGLGTIALGINREGTIIGDVFDSGNGAHGFVGTLKGGFTNFDAPGADPVLGCTCPTAINDLGVIGGYSVDSQGVGHGFVRMRDGDISVFDAPGAYTAAAGSGTYVTAVNDLGAAVGYFFDANFIAHGFIRAADGKFTPFDDPASGLGTWPYSINNFGAIVGATTYSTGVSVGFLRSPHGKIEEFQFPSVTYDNTQFINDRGVIAGSYSQVYANSQPYDFEAFQRTPDGKMTTFSAPGSGTTTSYPFEGTFIHALNNFGTITGRVIDDQAETHGFVREPDGKITVFSYPGQAAVPGLHLGSGGFAINAEGVVAGFWNDSNLAFHGLIRLPGETDDSPDEKTGDRR